MTDDRTERALDDAARQIDAPLGTVLDPAIEPSRVVRRSTPPVPALVAVVLLLLGGAVATIATRDTSDRIRVGSSTTNGGSLPAGRADLEVFMRIDATADQVAGVRTVLETSPDVVVFSFRTKDDVYDEFRQTHVCDPDLVASLSPQDFSTSFRVVVVDRGESANLLRSLQTMPGVDTVAEPWRASVPLEPDQSSTECSESGDSEATLVQPTVVPQPVATLPPESAEVPADPEAARQEIIDVYRTSHDGSIPIELRRDLFEDGIALAASFDQGGAGQEALTATMSATVLEVRFQSPTRAAVLYTRFFGGRPNATLTSYAVLGDDGHWRESRESWCGELARQTPVRCPA